MAEGERQGTGVPKEEAFDRLLSAFHCVTYTDKQVKERKRKKRTFAPQQVQESYVCDERLRAKARDKNKRKIENEKKRDIVKSRYSPYLLTTGAGEIFNR